MTAAGPYIENLQEIKVELKQLRTIIAKVARQVDEMYNWDYEETTSGGNVTQVEDRHAHDEAEIKARGQRIPYNLISDPVDVSQFRDFIYNAKSRYKMFTEDELRYLDFADKNFEDIRLTRKHIGILQGVYFKLYSKPWPFKSKQGYMYKLDNEMIWEWFE